MNTLKFDTLKNAYRKAMSETKKPFVNVMRGSGTQPVALPTAFREPPKQMPAQRVAWPEFKR